MKYKISDEVIEKLNFKERIIVKIFMKLCIKIYKKGIEKGVNALL